MLLVHHDQADVRQRCEDRGARAHDDAHVAGDGGVAHGPALAVGEPGVQHGDLIAEARGEAASGLRRERDLGHQHEHRAAARERALGGAQVDLGLARSRDSVEQEVSPARLEQPLDLRDGGRLRLGQGLGRRGAPGGHARHAQAGVERDQAVLREAADGRGGRPRALDELGERQRTVGEQLQERAPASRRARQAGGRDPRVARRAHARRQRQGERARGRRAVVGGDPEAQLQHHGSDAGLVGEPLDARELALVLRRTGRLDDDAAHAAPGQRHVHDIAARQRMLGREVVERLAQGARRHERHDANGKRRSHREDHRARVGRQPRADGARSCRDFLRRSGAGRASHRAPVRATRRDPCAPT